MCPATLSERSCGPALWVKVPTAMADIAPLRPLRYAAADLSNLVAPPYDVISPSERLELMARSPHNVVRLILPDGEGDAKYGHAQVVLESCRKKGALVRDDQPTYYRYY